MPMPPILKLSDCRSSVCRGRAPPGAASRAADACATVILLVRVKIDLIPSILNTFPTSSCLLLHTNTSYSRASLIDTGNKGQR